MLELRNVSKTVGGETHIAETSLTLQRGTLNVLLGPTLWSGWGVRTMASDDAGYNPLAYHDGTVWPHDNSLIAHGMALHELRQPAIHLLTTLFQAALNFRDYRLPELFCGVHRRENDEPVHYPVSCSPQAWASATPVQMLRTLLRFDPDVPRRKAWLSPAMPVSFPDLTLHHLPLAGSHSPRFTRVRSSRSASATTAPGSTTAPSVHVRSSEG